MVEIPSMGFEKAPSIKEKSIFFPIPVSIAVKENRTLFFNFSNNRANSSIVLNLKS